MYYVVLSQVDGVTVYGWRCKFVKNRENASLHDGPASAKYACYRLFQTFPYLDVLYYEPFAPQNHAEVPRMSFTKDDYLRYAQARTGKWPQGLPVLRSALAAPPSGDEVLREEPLALAGPVVPGQ